MDYTYESASARFKLGAIKIDAMKVLGLGLTIIPSGDHANINSKVPFDLPGNESEVIKWAEAIIKCC